MFYFKKSVSNILILIYRIRLFRLYLLQFTTTTVCICVGIYQQRDIISFLSSSVDVLTCDEHEYGGGGDVAGAAAPAADHAGPERHEQEQERHHEQRHCRARHVQSGMYSKKVLVRYDTGMNSSSQRVCVW